MKTKRKFFYLITLSPLTLIITYFTFPMFTRRISTLNPEPHKTHSDKTSHHISQELYHVAYPYTYHFILDNPKVCLEEKPLLLLMVPVAPNNQASREAIRNTWGNTKLVLGWKVQTLFILGLSSGEGAEKLQEHVLQESEEKQDLLQADFLDSYHNLTIKTMLMMEWLSSRCPSARYAMKVDTDVFLNVPNLVKMLQDLRTPKKNFITGNLERSVTVKRKQTAKWYMPWKFYKLIRYPPYINGHGYVFSMDLPKKILSASRHVKAVYLEDIYIGMCLKHLEIKPTPPSKRFLFLYKQPKNFQKWTGIFFLLQSSDMLVAYWEKWIRSDGTCCQDQDVF